MQRAFSVWMYFQGTSLNMGITLYILGQNSPTFMDWWGEEGMVLCGQLCMQLYLHEWQAFALAAHADAA